MESNNYKKGLANLTKKAATVIGVALAALTNVNAKATVTPQNEDVESISIHQKEKKIVGNPKPMPILKINLNNPDGSRLVASHRSHRSHSSHSSHSSHRSHYSHRSGGMF